MCVLEIISMSLESTRDKRVLTDLSIEVDVADIVEHACGAVHQCATDTKG